MLNALTGGAGAALRERAVRLDCARRLPSTAAPEPRHQWTARRITFRHQCSTSFFSGAAAPAVALGSGQAGDRFAALVSSDSEPTVVRFLGYGAVLEELRTRIALPDRWPAGLEWVSSRSYRHVRAGFALGLVSRHGIGCVTDVTR
jgi:hypothetical protein